jgi:hypothetical protein
MLLIEPPLALAEWSRVKFLAPRPGRSLDRYCRSYESAVLSLPDGQLRKIVLHLLLDYEHCEVGPEAFHRIVERELTEEEFEPSSKVARLMVLDSLADMLRDEGIEVLPQTRRMLTFGREVIPLVLLHAIDDHFGVLQDTH